MKSLNSLAAYVVGVFATWAFILAVGYFVKGPTRLSRSPCFGGFLLGLLSIHIVTRVYPDARKNIQAPR
jgi:hypothetical protein